MFWGKTGPIQVESSFAVYNKGQIKVLKVGKGQADGKRNWVVVKPTALLGEN